MIQAKSLTKIFRKRPVLDNIDIEINRGERVIFVGKNGSGKTTFIRCLLGLYMFEGLLQVDGLHPRLNRVELLKRIGYVPQMPPPINRNVMDLIEYAAKLSGKPSEPILKAAEALNLNTNGDDLHRSFLKLSGGMKQKLMIAISIGRGNDIIIMDEPTSNLDPESRKIFYELLSSCPSDTTILLTSHRADEFGFLTSRVIEMDYGRVVRDTGEGCVQ